MRHSGAIKLSEQVFSLTFSDISPTGELSHIFCGISMPKVLPLFSQLSTISLPPMLSARSFEIASPRPVPSTAHSTAFLPRPNTSKMCSSSFEGIPMPVSETVILRTAFFSSSPQGTVSAESFTPPDSVYLTALEIKFVTICLRWFLSPSSMDIICGENSVSKSSPFFPQSSLPMEASSDISESVRYGFTAVIIFPDSIWVTSRILFIIESSKSPALCIFDVYSLISLRSEERVISSFIPRITFMGVRISWLMFARKIPFALLLRLASAIASSS